MFHVVIDNLYNKAMGIFSYESTAKDMLAELGNEKVGDDFYRYGSEEWSWEEVEKFSKDPANMGLNGYHPSLIVMPASHSNEESKVEA